MRTLQFVRGRSVRPLMLVTILVALIAAACSGGGASGPQSLTLNIKADPPTLDPAIGVTTDSLSVERQLFSGLMGYDADLSLVASVAREVSSRDNGGLSDDGTRVRIEIRTDARWSDGRAVTAGAFVYAFKRVLNPDTASDWAPFFYPVVGAQAYNTALSGERPASAAELAALREAVAISAPDDATLEIHLAGPSHTFLDVLALPAAFPLREDVVVAHGADWTRPGNLVGNGPFTLEAWATDDRIVLAGVVDWWGGRVRLDTLVFRMIPDDNAAYAAYLAGELDIVDVPAPFIATVLEDSDREGQVVRTTDLSTLALMVNVRIQPLADVQVRRALSSALDRETFVSVVQGGIGEAAAGWLPPTLPGSVVSAEAAARFDEAAGRALLADAGYADPADFPTLRLSYANVGPNQVRAEFVQEQFRRHLDIEVELAPMDPRAFGQSMFSGEFELALFSWTADFPDAENWLAELFRSDGSFNLGGYSSADFDAAVTAAMQEDDPERRLAHWAQAHALLMQDAPILTLAHTERVRLVQSGISGLITTPIDGQAAGDHFLAQTHWESGKLVAAAR